MSELIVFAVSGDFIEVGPVPPNGYAYRVTNGVQKYRSHDRYANEQSALADARRVQFVRDDGTVEPLDRAISYGRAPTHLA